MSEERVPFLTHGFSLVIVRNFDGRWLAIKETRDRGWWLPAGLVEQGETFVQAAHREVREEANIQVDLKGVLRVEHSVYGPTHARMRVIFFAVPVNSQPPKKTPDNESEEARWVTLQELKKLARTSPGLRGPELYEWGTYIEKGGMIAPLEFLCREDEPTPSPSPSYFRLYEPVGPKPDPGVLVQAIEDTDAEAVRKCALLGTEMNLPINDKLWTPLHLACRLNSEKVVYYLLIAGADPNACTHKGRNVLHFAAQSTYSILCMILVKLSKYINKKDIVNQQDSQGDTPLHFAGCMEHMPELWDELIKHGADPSIANYSGVQPAGVY